jgi:hypothetical protein
MKKLSLFSIPLFFPALLLTLLIAPQVRAETPSMILEQRLKASYNDMVQNVRQTDDPQAKRVIIAGFLTRLDRGLGVVEKIVPASKPAHLQAARMRATLQSDLAELKTMDLQGQAAGNNLNNFASYLQQDAEQAGGIYISVGAAIIILLLLIIIL